MPSAPTIISQTRTPNMAQPNETVSVDVLFSCDDEDTANTIRWSNDGGATWSSPVTVNAVDGSATVTRSFTKDRPGTASSLLEITDSEGLIKTTPVSAHYTYLGPMLCIYVAPSEVIHDRQTVTWNGMIGPPTPEGATLTLTVDWGAGAPADRFETIVLSEGDHNGFVLEHEYDLTTDQLLTVSISVDDGVGGTDSFSLPVTYDDVISDLVAKGVGRVGGVINFGLHSVVEAGTSGRTIAAYLVDIDDNGSFDTSYIVDEDTWDPEGVVIDGVDGLSLLGNPSVAASFTGRFIVVTSDGVFDFATFPIAVAASVPLAALPLTHPSLGSPVVTVGPLTTLTIETIPIQDRFQARSADLLSTLESVGGEVRLNATKLGEHFNQFTLELFSGVEFRAEVTSFLTPYYFVQYARQVGLAIVNGMPTVLQDSGIILDSGSPGPVNPGAYMGQNYLGTSTLMNDTPGIALTLAHIDRKTISSRWDKVTGDHIYKMTRTIAAEYAQNPVYQQWVQNGYHEIHFFETYIVDQTTDDPLGFIFWKYRITATAAGFVFQWNNTPIYAVGIDANVWNGGY